MSVPSSPPLPPSSLQFPPPRPPSQPPRESIQNSSITITINVPETSHYRHSRGAVIAKIEDILAGLLNALSDDDPSLGFKFEFRSRSARRNTGFVRFPGTMEWEPVKFTRVLMIIHLSHAALVGGNILTKKNIYYQDKDLFSKQEVVNGLVDDLAHTLGVGRHGLGIVATSKGLVAGPIIFNTTSGSKTDCSDPNGTPIPPLLLLTSLTLPSPIKAIIVIEKEATFRTLSNSLFHSTSLFAPLLLVSGKGYPDLVTREFLALLSSARERRIPMAGLVDWDPDGVGLWGCYRSGGGKAASAAARSMAVAAAAEGTAYQGTMLPNLLWLGVKSWQVLPLVAKWFGDGESASTTMAAATDTGSAGGEDIEKGAGAGAETEGQTQEKPVLLTMTKRDRKRAISLLEDGYPSGDPHILHQPSSDDKDDEHDPHVLEWRRELQLMLFLNVKAEIQAVDRLGNIGEWVDEQLTEFMGQT